VIRLNDFGEEADDATGGIKFAAFLAFGAGKFAKKIFVDAPKSVVIRRGRNLGNLF
jgi:hypothetical protein